MSWQRWRSGEVFEALDSQPRWRWLATLAGRFLWRCPQCPARFTSRTEALEHWRVSLDPHVYYARQRGES